jgi:hypothetical protein
MRKFLALATVIALPLTAACGVHQDTAPSPSGPAELGLSLKLLANPDRVPMDGVSGSAVQVIAFDAGGHPIAVQVHLDVNPAGFGTLLSANFNNDVMTSTDLTRPTTVTFVPPGAITGTPFTVTLSATMVGPNAVTSATQQVSVVVAPAAFLNPLAPQPVAVITPTPPAQSFGVGKLITFDASGSCGTAFVGSVCPGTSPITKYVWNFGDNSAPSNFVNVTHAYGLQGSYNVVLTVTNAQGRSSSVVQAIVIQTASAPTAVYNVSPQPPIKVSSGNPNANFNASQSTAAAGHAIVNYAWNFGDGTTATTTTPFVSHFYGVPNNTYITTLTVTDDIGQSSTSSQNVSVIP